MAVSELNDMGHDVFAPRSDKGIKAYAFHEDSDTKLELERVNGVLELSHTSRSDQSLATQTRTLLSQR